MNASSLPLPTVSQSMPIFNFSDFGGLVKRNLSYLLCILTYLPYLYLLTVLLTSHFTYSLTYSPSYFAY